MNRNLVIALFISFGLHGLLFWFFNPLFNINEQKKVDTRITLEPPIINNELINPTSANNETLKSYPKDSLKIENKTRNTFSSTLTNHNLINNKGDSKKPYNPNPISQIVSKSSQPPNGSSGNNSAEFNAKNQSELENYSQTASASESSSNIPSDSSNGQEAASTQLINQNRDNQPSTGAYSNRIETDQSPANQTIENTVKKETDLENAKLTAIKSFTLAVNKACNAAKYYPESLQAQGTAGKVTLLLVFVASGLESVSVFQSSGNNELDQAAINAVQKAKLPMVPELLRERLPIKVKITLSYKLKINN